MFEELNKASEEDCRASRPMTDGRRDSVEHKWNGKQADAFAKTVKGKRNYAWYKKIIEQFLIEVKEPPGLRYTCTLGIRSIYKQFFFITVVWNMKCFARTVRSSFMYPLGNSSLVELVLYRWSGGYAFPFVVVKTSSVWCSNRLQIDDFIFILKKKDIMLLWQWKILSNLSLILIE